MARPLRLLLAEDVDDDAELVLGELRRGGYVPAVRRVESADGLRAALDDRRWEFVLSDYSMPSFTGLEAFAIVRGRDPDVPFILISGTVGEEMAVRAMKAGIQDFVLKGSFARLVPAVDRELAEAPGRRARGLQIAVSQVLANSNTLDEAAPALLRSLATGLGAEAGELWLVDDAENLLICPHRWDAPAGLEVRAAHSFAPGEGIPGSIWTSGRPLFRAGLSEESGVPTRAILGFPVFRGSEVIGVLVFSARDILPPGELLLEELAGLGGQIGQFIASRRGEDELRESAQRLRLVIKATRDIVWARNLATNEFEWGDGFSSLLGCRPEEIDPTFEFWLERVHPDDRPRVGSTFETALRTGEDFLSVEYRLLRAGGSYASVLDRACIQRDGNGNPVRAIGAMHDVTDQKQLEEQFRQAQKMEALGRLAGGVAHDFNNLLTTILGYSELLLNRLPPESGDAGDVKEIRKAGERAADLTRQLLAFSRKQVAELKVLDANSVLKDLDKMLRRLVGEDIQVKTILSPELGRVKADPGQLEQVVLNLVVNAGDAMPRGGRLTIETANVELDESYTRYHAGIRPGPYVMIAVSDTGTGIPPELMGQIFEPFFTTKAKGKGTGLGLSTVYGIVSQGGGHIWPYSEPGHGTVFKVYLPRVEEAVSSLSDSGPVRSLSRGTETILLVEDQEPVRALARRILFESGYEVLEAGDGAEALELASRHGRVQLLLTDTVMPGLSGPELAAALQGRQPGIRVLFMSGYTDSAILVDGVLAAGAAFLSKPFSPGALLRKVREVLDAVELPKVSA